MSEFGIGVILVSCVLVAGILSIVWYYFEGVLVERKKESLKKMKPCKGKWETACFCAKCASILTGNEVYFSDGVCPHCGHVKKGTIVDYRIRARRRVVDVEGNPTWEYGDTCE